jgi:serine/threonine-protein kinase
MDERAPSDLLAFSLVQALDSLRDGLRPFVVKLLEQKEGPQWYAHPRVQRMVPLPPALDDEPPHGPENPVLDLALVLKLIGSDCYWYRTFRPQLPGISRWQIDSLRELRNRVAHNDGEDPLFCSTSLVLPYLNTMEQLLRVVGSEKANDIIRIRSGLQRRRRQILANLALGRSRWSVPFWLASVAAAATVFWLFDYLRSPRIERAAIVIGTPDQRLDRYRPLEQHLESKLRPAQVLRALRGERVDVRVEGARSYPEAVAHLRARRWDVLLGFSPVVSMESINVGYRPIGLMFPQDPDYRSILFARSDSSLKSLNDITPATRVALGDFFSATKYYVPMSMLQGRSARVLLNLSTAEIAEQVRTGRSDVGAMAGHPKQFEGINPGLRVLASSAPLPQSLVALSPSLGDLDRDRLERALLRVPDSIRGRDAANFGAGKAPDYRAFSRQVAEGKAFSACLSHQAAELSLSCRPAERVDSVEGWIDDVRPEMEQIRISLSTADRRSFAFLINRALLEKSAVFQVLNDLNGRFVRVIALRHLLDRQPVVLETPHQLDISP